MPNTSKEGLGREQSPGFLPLFDLLGNALRRGVREVLAWRMTELESPRETVEYRGYSLQVSFASPQWQVLIGMVVKDRPAVPPERQIVKGWNEEETLKRAKTRVDLLIESPSLH